ncbi:MAG TPA: zf-HC2 domain-containing protein [Polyangiaceae bacterium]
MTARTPASSTSLSCKEVSELVTEGMEGALPADLRDGFADHLCGCEACRTFGEQIDATVRIVRMLPRDAGPEPGERVMEAFRTRARK